LNPKIYTARKKTFIDSGKEKPILMPVQIAEIPEKNDILKFHPI